MAKAVRYDEFGGIEVLRVDDVDRFNRCCGASLAGKPP